MSQQLVVISIEQLQSIIDISLSKLIPLISPQIKEVPQDTGPKYITRKEACSLLSITYPTLDKYTSRGILKAYYIGRRVLYIPAELLVAVESNINLKGYRKKAA